VFKINVRFLVIMLLFAAFIVGGCGKAEIECSANSDCNQRTCSTASCIQNQCKYTIIPNCCGNSLKEAVENGKAGSSCTCPADYGACEGKAQSIVNGRAFETEYVEKFCQQDECITGVPKEKIRQISLLDEHDFNFFIVETIVTYNEPFDASGDLFRFRISVKDDSQDLVFPIKLNKIILKDGEIVYGEKQLDLFLNGLGDTVKFDIPVFYQLENVEKVGRLSYQINYEYNKRVKETRLPNGSYSYKQELVRDDYENKFTTKLTFFESK
jgi:hypothetical protein